MGEYPPLPPMRFLLLAALATLAASGPTAQTCTTTWQPERVGTDGQGNPIFQWTDGAWENASRWSGGVPTANDTACITGPGANGPSVDFTVTSSAAGQVGGLVVGNDLGFRSVRVIFGAPMTGIRAGRVFGNDRIDGQFTVDGPFEVENAWLSGTLTVGPQGALTVVQSEGNGGNGFASQLGCASFQGRPRLDQLALVVDGGRVEIRESVSLCGRVEWTGGTLAVRADDRDGNRTRFRTLTASNFAPGNDGPDNGFFRGGTFDVDAETEVSLGGFYRVSGAFGGTSDGDLRFTQNNLTNGGGGLIVEGDDATFAVGGAHGIALSRGGEYLITSEGGEIVNAGLLRFAGAGRTFRGATLRSTGTVQVEGSAQTTLTDGSDIVIERDGTLLLTDIDGQGNRRIESTGGFGTSESGEERLVLRGRLVEDGNGATDFIYVPIDVDGGRFEGIAGRLSIRGGGTLRDAVADVAEDAEITLSSPRNDFSMTYTVSGRLTGSSQGEFQFAGPTRVAIDESVEFDVSGAGVQIGSGQQTFAPGPDGGSLLNSGRTAAASGLTLDGLAVRNEGTFAISGQYTLTGGAEVTNPDGGTLAFESASATTNEADEGRFVNEGLAVVGGTSSSQFRGRLVSRPGSEIRADHPGNNSVNFQLADSVAYRVPFVTLSGDGNFSFNVSASDLELPGTLSPGSPEAPFGTITVSAPNFTPTSRLVVDLGPDETDFVSSNNRFNLAGTLVVRTPGEFVPSVGDEFVIGRGTSTQTPLGSFDTVTSEGGRGPTFEVDTSRPGQLVVRVAGAAPSSALAQAASAGDTRIEVADTSPFQIGDRVVIGAGTANAETRTVVGFGSLILDQPLAFAHASGEAVVVSGSPVSNEADAPEDAPQLTVGLPFPNPTAGRATVPVTLAASGPLRVAVYDVLGREVAVAFDGPAGAGPLAVEVGGGLAPGAYVVRVVGPGVAEVRRLTVTR